MPRVDVSFKKTSRDMRLYLAVVNQEEKSGFVKDAIDTTHKCSFFIDIHKNTVDFYFIIPQKHESLIGEKIRENGRNSL